MISCHFQTSHCFYFCFKRGSNQSYSGSAWISESSSHHPHADGDSLQLYFLSNITRRAHGCQDCRPLNSRKETSLSGVTASAARPLLIPRAVQRPHFFYQFISHIGRSALLNKLAVCHIITRNLTGHKHKACKGPGEASG